ncbi:MAG: hypothetical protein ABI856_16640, partial [Nitrospira sp.]
MRYSHGGHGWNQQLRRAITQLETMVLSDGLSYRQPPVELDIAFKAVNSSEDQGKGWWSQRDLNPCLSLESRY